MGMTERFGGIWFEQTLTTVVLVSDEYDSELDAITSIYQRVLDGHYEVAFWIKGKADSDPQWSLPLWGSIASQGIFGTFKDAQAHLRAIRDEHAGTPGGA
jgi:hypothetical protein